MENRNLTPERILDLTVEISYLLTGEDYIIVKNPGDHRTPQRSSGFFRIQSPSTVPTPLSVIHEGNKGQKILELTNTIIHLLTGEVWKYLEVHEDHPKHVVVETPNPFSSAGINVSLPCDGSTRNPEDRLSMFGNEGGRSTAIEGGTRAEADFSTSADPMHTEHPSPHIKEESASCDGGGGDPSDTNIYPPAEHPKIEDPSTLMVQEMASCEEGNLTHNDSSVATEHTGANYPSSHVKEEPASSGGLIVTVMDHEPLARQTYSTFSLTEERGFCGEGNLPGMISPALTEFTQNELVFAPLNEGTDSWEEGNSIDLNSYTSKGEEYTSSGSRTVPASSEEGTVPGRDSSTFMERTQTNHHLPTPIKKKLASVEQLKVTDMDLFMSIEQEPLSCTTEEPTSCEEGRLPDKNSSAPTKTDHLCMHVKAKSASHVESNPPNSHVCTPTDHPQTEYVTIREKQPDEDTQELREASGLHYTGCSRNPNRAYHWRRSTLKMHTCSSCHKCFNDSFDLCEHQKRHAAKKHRCPECGKYFVSKTKLTTHQRIHTKEKPFTCAECGKCYTQKGDLKRHQMVHTGEKPFSCSECKKGFNHKSALSRHQKIHTGEKPFSCPECGKCFIQSVDLQAHLRVHTGAKPFTCFQCGKCFRQGSHLTSHQRVHTGVKPFCCPDCGKCFTNHSNRSKHRRIHAKL